MTTQPLVQHGEMAYEAIRSLNHATIARAVPAPLAYDLLGDLHRVGYALAQLADQIGTGLARSLTEFDVYDHNRDPAVSVAMAAEALREAAEHAHTVGECLSRGQAAINHQGYTLPDEGDQR